MVVFLFFTAGIISAADRLCLPRLVTLVESAVVHDLTEADKDGEDIIEDVLKLIEPAQVGDVDLFNLFLKNQEFEDKANWVLNILHKTIWILITFSLKNILPKKS